MRAPMWLTPLIVALVFAGGWSCSGTEGEPDGSTPLDGNTSGDDDNIDPARLCPPEQGVLFTAACAEPAEPGWMAKGDLAVWEETDGSLMAVASSTIDDASMSRGQASTRATALLLAHLQGVPPSEGDCMLETWVEGDLSCVETRSTYLSEGTRFALAALPARLDEVACPVPDPILRANCPAPPALAHVCDCIAPEVPAWMDRGLFLPGDGYVYATGIASAEDPAERAQNRATAELTNYYFGETIQAGPDGEACIVSSQSSQAAFGKSLPRVEPICDQVVGQERYALVRCWMGPPQ